jgi:hypothetical protein
MGAFDTIDLLETLSFQIPKNKTPTTSTEKGQKPPEMYNSFPFSMRVLVMITSYSSGTLLSRQILK